MKTNVEVTYGTRPCIATVAVRHERTDDELMEMSKELGITEVEYAEWAIDNRYYYKPGQVEAKWHMFAQQDDRAVAVVEFDDGSVKAIGAECVRFIDVEEGNNE